MPVTIEADGAEDVKDFLERIREMGDQRDREDEERTRKLEEEILQGRKERQARRSERARSLSPTKDVLTPSSTPGLTHSNNERSVIGDLYQAHSMPEPPSGQSVDMDDIRQKQNGATSIVETHADPVPFKPRDTSGTSPRTTAAPARSNPLSWQQRPSSRGSTGSARNQALSSSASEKSASKPPQPGSPTASESDDRFSRSQIAQSLGAKDATFFRQTQDRGLGSAAYKKSPVNNLADAVLIGSNRKLPGMSRDGNSKLEPHERSPTEASHPDSSSAEGSTLEKVTTRDGYQASVSIPSTGGFRSPLSTSNNHRFGPLSSDATSSFESDDAPSARRTMAMSPSQGRISTENTQRPVSPTKGLGGFVQSAMMKRSDSVNKRWSAQAGPGGNRRDSVASNSGGLDGMRLPLGGVTPLTESRNNNSREITPIANSRPTSSDSNANLVQPSMGHQVSEPGLSSKTKDTEQYDRISGPTSLSENKSTTPPKPLSPIKGNATMGPPSSPSKRWSPTKSSWLENAISKPESPKVLSPSVAQQPAWMADYYRNKQQRGSVDLGKSSIFKEVAVGGLIRSPPPGTGYNPPLTSEPPKDIRSGVASASRIGNSDEILRRTDSSDSTRPISKLSGSSTTPNLSGRGDKVGALPEVSLHSSQKDSFISNAKPKPETPPKKDLRTTLKPQQKPRESKDKDEPEFKNVFGKLKKTQTQNYIAPDELKDNIRRGKSGLAKTDGPQKSNIKDDFKESILKKKEGMIAPSASTKITSVTSKDPKTSIPEAIAKRQDLGRSEITVADGSFKGEKPALKPEALVKLQILQKKPSSVAPEKQVRASTAIQQAAEKPKSGLNVGFASSLAGMLQRGPSPSGGDVKPSPISQEGGDLNGSAAAKPEATKQSQSGQELTHVTKGRARGPKRKLPTSAKQEIDVSHTTAPTKEPLKPIVVNKEVPGSSPIPRHTASHDRSTPQPLTTITNINNPPNGRRAPQSDTPRSPSISTETVLMSKPSPMIAQAPVGELLTKASSRISSEGTQIANTLEPQKTVVPTPVKSSLRDLEAQETVQREAASYLIAQRLEENQPQKSIKDATVIRGRSPKPMKSSLPPPPGELPTRQDGRYTAVDADLLPEDAVGLGINTSLETALGSYREAASPSTTSAKSAKLSPLPGRKPATLQTKPISPPSPSPAPPQRSLSPSKGFLGSAALLNKVFDESPISKTRINIDTQAILDKPPSSNPDKIKTLRKQMFEILGNGKSVSVPSQQEHILFEDSLYVCIHVFDSSAGARTSEVYLWCGDGVSPSSIEDAQLFAKKTARDNSGRLIVLSQGKETSSFFQALGGIVITRKGSSSRSDSATYMLCGRRHLGQIAFDEVDFGPQSLCSGFPYIISARGGRLYLWKGSGSSADELGCARLIGMDLGLTGEIEEIDEGSEPPDFWNSFPSGLPKRINVPFALPHWSLKSSCDKYTTKLFTIDVENPRLKSSSGFMSWGRRGSVPTDDTGTMMEARIKEVTPFSQVDFSEEGVFLLDTFFEIFVVLPLRTSLNPAPQHRSTKAASLYAALLFAQEYSILAASAEDRPFVPHGSVVIIAKNDDGPKGLGEGEVPEGVKRCFRKWDSRGVGGADVKVLSLAEALAFKES